MCLSAVCLSAVCTYTSKWYRPRSAMANFLVFIMSKSFVYTVINGRSERPTLVWRSHTHLRNTQMGVDRHDHAYFHVRSDFSQDFEISGKISRFRLRFQDFQDFRQDFKISGKISEISRFHARFQDFSTVKISIEMYEISRVSDPSN